MPVQVAGSLIVAARLAAGAQQWENAATLLSKANAMLEETGQSLYEDDVRLAEEVLASAREKLGTEQVDRIGRTARELEVPAAADIARGVFNGVASEASPTPGA